MFANDLCRYQIEYFRNAINLNRKDRAKPPLRSVSPLNLRTGSGLAGVIRLRLGERYRKSSIFNLQFRLVRVGYNLNHATFFH
jgi:hypothetical protein